MAKKPHRPAASEDAEERAETPAMKRREGKNDNEVGLSDIHAMYAKKPGRKRGC